MKSSLLDVIAVYFNPIRWDSRINRHKEFEQHMLDSGVRLTTVECAYGDRDFELLGNNDHINRVRVRSNSLVWNKENLINLGVSRLPHDWKYVSWVDADIHFRKPQWAAETVQALQHYKIVQPWQHAYDLGPNDEHVQTHTSFASLFYSGKPVCKEKPHWWTWEGGSYEFAHPGYAWACDRQTFNDLGGLFEHGACGSGDHHMALALIGKAKYSVPGKVHPSYLQSILDWEKRAVQHIRKEIGYVVGSIEHFWHGRKDDRKYVNRWDIITKHQFNPHTDIKKNSYGVVELAGNKPDLTLDMDRYFRQRNEDINSL